LQGNIEMEKIQRLSMLSGWLLLAVALSDPGIWLLIALPVVMRLKK
jgi:hypothetical protein